MTNGASFKPCGLQHEDHDGTVHTCELHDDHIDADQLGSHQCHCGVTF
jgi:hypothetical protein